jgi:long-subunit acyl-CoA synthetase (AMP-forming)
MDRSERPQGAGTLAGHARYAKREAGTVRSLLDVPGSPESIGSMLARNAERLDGHAAFCERRAGSFVPVAWRALRDDACALAAFLASAGVADGDRVAVVSPNRGGMIVAELATMCLGAVYVPIFAGYAPDQTSALLRRADARVVIVPDESWLARLTIPPSARAVVSFERPAGAQATGFDEIVARLRDRMDGSARQSLLRAAAAVDPHAACLMMYTSGTSGELKGVLLTHENILSQRRAVASLWQLGAGDRFLSYLPWHHSFGGIFEKFGALYSGATLYIDDSLGKDFDLLLRNWLEVRPTIYFSVPKIYQQLVARAQTNADDAERIFHPGLRFVFTAAAPLPDNLSGFFAARGIPVVEGWGLTETAPCCTLTDPSEPRSVPGLVGYPLPGVTIGIAPDGEILVRGPNVMLGYHDDAAATRRAIGGDGWFHTGDLGELHGAALRLLARKDRVFKMSNAEKVVPTGIENRLAGMNGYIRHVIVTGEGRQYLTAIVFPDFFRIAEEFGDDRVRAEAEVKASLRDTIREFNLTHPVRYERIQALAVVGRELTVEHQELTPSLKVRVRTVLAGAEEYVDAVYEPAPECDCRVLRRIMRLAPDERPCFGGFPRRLDQCHECGWFILADPPGSPAGPAFSSGEGT